MSVEVIPPQPAAKRYKVEWVLTEDQAILLYRLLGELSGGCLWQPYEELADEVAGLDVEEERSNALLHKHLPELAEALGM